MRNNIFIRKDTHNTLDFNVSQFTETDLGMCCETKTKSFCVFPNKASETKI